MNIKIKHTKTHKTTTYNNKTFGGILMEVNTLVTDTELVLVECTSIDGLFNKYLGDPLVLHDKKYGAGRKYYKPILISRTEKIEVGDWFLQTTYKGIFKCTKISDKYIHFDNDSFEPIEYCHKILALPEHFSPQQLQQIVDGKLKDGSIVLLECEELAVRYRSEHKLEKFIKLNPHITLYPVEEKTYTLQEISEKFIGESKKGGYFDDYLDYILLEEPKPRPTFKEWFEKNVK